VRRAPGCIPFIGGGGGGKADPDERCPRDDNNLVLAELLLDAVGMPLPKALEHQLREDGGTTDYETADVEEYRDKRKRDLRRVIDSNGMLGAMLGVLLATALEEDVDPEPGLSLLASMVDLGRNSAATCLEVPFDSWVLPPR